MIQLIPALFGQYGHNLNAAEIVGGGGPRKLKNKDKGARGRRCECGIDSERHPCGLLLFVLDQ
jgi:hypothetical protein